MADPVSRAHLASMVSASKATRVRLGAMGDLEAMQKTGAARQAAVGQLKSLADAYDQMARASGNPKFISDAAAFRASVEKLGAEADVMGYVPT